MKPLTKIQASAKGEDCTFNLPGCSHDPEQTVLCHDTRHVPGSPRKHDLRAAYGDMNCHDLIDDRTPNDMDMIEQGYEWGIAIARTHVRLEAKGLIQIVGVEHEPSKILPRKRYGELLK